MRPRFLRGCVATFVSDVSSCAGVAFGGHETQRVTNLFMLALKCKVLLANREEHFEFVDGEGHVDRHIA